MSNLSRLLIKKEKVRMVSLVKIIKKLENTMSQEDKTRTKIKTAIAEL